MRPLLLHVVGWLALAVAGPTASTAADSNALRLEAGTLAQREVVAVGRDLTVDGEARENAVAIAGSVSVTGEVHGNVIALGGSVRLLSGARVRGDVCAVGGVVETAANATIGGRTLAYPTAPSAFLVLMEGPALGLEPLSPVVLAAKLSLVAAWMLTALVFLRFFPRPLQETVTTVTDEPFRCFFAGLTAILGGVMVIALLTRLLAPLAGVPLVALLALLALVLKLWGLVAVCTSFGGWILRQLPGRRLAGVPPVQATFVGLMVLSTIKLVPYVGTGAWSMVSLVGVGAALISRFGQQPLPSAQWAG